MRYFLACLAMLGSLCADEEVVLPIIRQGASADLTYTVETTVHIELPDMFMMMQVDTPEQQRSITADGQILLIAKSADVVSARCTTRRGSFIEADFGLQGSALIVARNGKTVISEMVAGESRRWHPIRFHRQLGNCIAMVQGAPIARDSYLEHTRLDQAIYERLLGTNLGSAIGFSAHVAWLDAPKTQVYRSKGKLTATASYEGPASEWDRPDELVLRGKPLSGAQLVYQILDEVEFDTRDLEIECVRKANSVEYSAPMAAGLSLLAERVTKVNYTLDYMDSEGAVTVTVTEKIEPAKFSR